MRSYVALIIMAVLLAVAGTGHTQDLPLRKMELRHETLGAYSGGGRVSLMDSNGHVWFYGSGYGLILFDGDLITVFSREHGIVGMTVNMFQDAYGYLWVVNEEAADGMGGIVRSNHPVRPGPLPEDFRFDPAVDGASLATGIRTGAVMTPDRRTLYAFVDLHLIRYTLTDEHQLRTDTIRTSREGDIDDMITTLVYHEVRGEVWFFTSSGDLYRIPDDPTGPGTAKWVRKLARSQEVYSVDERGRLLTANDVGVEVIDPERLLADSSYTPPLIPLPNTQRLVNVISAGNGQLLALVQGVAIYAIDGQTHTLAATYAAGAGLPEDLYLDIYRDRTGDIWVAATGGVYVMRGDYRSVMPSLPPPELRVPGEIYITTTVGGPDSTWLLLSTTNGLLIGDEPTGNWMRVGEAEGLPAGVVSSLVYERGGRIFVVSNSYLYCIAPRGKLIDGIYADQVTELTIFGEAYELAPLHSSRTFTINLVEFDDGRFAVLSGSEYLMHLYADTGPPLVVRTENGYAGNYLMNFHRADDGTLLLYSTTGLQRTTAPITPARIAELQAGGESEEGKGVMVADSLFVESFTIPVGDTSELTSLASLYRHRDEYWVGADSGLYRIDPRLLTVNQHIPHEDIMVPGSFVASAGSVYVGTQNGLVKVDPVTNSVSKHYGLADGVSGISNSSSQALSVSRDGTINYATIEGLVRLRPDLYRERPAIPPLGIRQLAYAEDGWGTNELTLRYTAANYADNWLTYETLLEGYDTDWQQQHTKKTLRFTNLRAVFFPKTYTFRVRATDRWGERMEAEQTELTVTPPFYLRWWAFLIYLGLFALVIRAFTRYRVREAERAIRLEEAATIRTQRDEIATKNAQNELLLKEIHHRVKNNLETVASLLELQSASLSDEQAVAAMQAGQSRVQSMGLLHQKLYQGEHLAAIEMRDYIRNLATVLQETYNAYEVAIDIDMYPLQLDVDTAVPLGLIVNELLTNSLKYAFGGADAGAIRVTLTKLDTGNYRLVVADNGYGKQFGESPRGTGFGGRLVALLTRQLRGTLSERNEGGLRTELIFWSQDVAAH